MASPETSECTLNSSAHVYKDSDSLYQAQILPLFQNTCQQNDFFKNFEVCDIQPNIFEMALSPCKSTAIQ